MSRRMRPRFWLEATAALVGTLLTVLTLVAPTWIEALSGESPDGGNGESEWLLALLPLAVAALSATLALREWRRVSA
jgi:hypothetical protein